MVLTDYIYWHYAVASFGILGLLRNYLIGTWHRFLIGTHFKHLFAPWHRVRPSDTVTPRSFGDKVANSIVDFYIRIIAAIIRLIIISVGLIAEVIVIAAFLSLFVIWLLWPITLIYSITKGVSLL